MLYKNCLETNRRWRISRSVIDETYLQHPDSVEKYVTRALELFPDKIDFHISKGHVMNSSKQYGLAVKAYKESLAMPTPIRCGA